MSEERQWNSDEEMLAALEAGNIAERALAVLIRYGQEDGAHHKMWAIDQAVRILAGSEYQNILAIYKQDGEYDWDEGIAP